MLELSDSTIVAVVDGASIETGVWANTMVEVKIGGIQNSVTLQGGWLHRKSESGTKGGKGWA
jgi:hypothetical protein